MLSSAELTEPKASKGSVTHFIEDGKCNQLAITALVENLGGVDRCYQESNRVMSVDFCSVYPPLNNMMCVV